MKGFIFGLLVCMCMMFAGCSMITIDGQVDDVEQSIIELAAGSALTLYPDAVESANKVSLVLLASADFEATTLSAIDTLISSKIDEMELTADEKATATELYNFIKTSVMVKMESLGIENAGTQIVVVQAVAQAVYDASAARM